MKDLRIVAKIYNNQLRERREALGMGSVEFARSIGIEPSNYCAYEGLKRKPVTRGTCFGRPIPKRWKSDALAIAGAFGVEPDALWPESIREIRNTKAEISVDAADLAAMLPPAESSPFGLLAAGEESMVLGAIVSELSTKEQDVVVSHFVNEETLDEIGGRYNLSREAVRQIGAKAIRKIRSHPRAKDIAR